MNVDACVFSKTTQTKEQVAYQEEMVENSNFAKYLCVCVHVRVRVCFELQLILQFLDYKWKCNKIICTKGY